MLTCAHPQCWFMKIYCDLYNVCGSVSPLNGSGLARLSRVYGSLSRESSFSWVSVSLEAKPTQRQRVTNAACSRLCNAHGIRTIIGDDTKVKCELSICAEDARCLLLPQEGVLSPDVRQLSLCRSRSQLRTTSATIFITYSRQMFLK